MKTLLRFLRDERGTETVEWAIIAGLIAVGAIVSIKTIGAKVASVFGTLATDLATIP
jgi:pilus assembly protein Flp/PilA